MHAISARPTDSGSACWASGTEMKIEYATAAAGAMCVIDWNSTCGNPIECSRRWSNPRAALVAPSIAILLKYGNLGRSDYLRSGGGNRRVQALGQRTESVSAGSGSPVSSRVFKLARIAGQPPEMRCSTSDPSGNPSCTTISRTFGPSGSISNVTFDRGSAAIAAVSSSETPTVAPNSGVNVWNVYDRRRGGSDSSTTCSGSAMVTPRCSHTSSEPTSQSDRNSTPQYLRVNAGSVSARQRSSGVVLM